MDCTCHLFIYYQLLIESHGKQRAELQAGLLKIWDVQEPRRIPGMNWTLPGMKKIWFSCALCPAQFGERSPQIRVKLQMHWGLSPLLCTHPQLAPAAAWGIQGQELLWPQQEGLAEPTWLLEGSASGHWASGHLQEGDTPEQFQPGMRRNSWQ